MEACTKVLSKEWNKRKQPALAGFFNSDLNIIVNEAILYLYSIVLLNDNNLSAPGKTHAR